MRSARFRVAAFVEAPRSEILAVLGDLREYGRFHPLLLGVTELPRDPAAPDTQRCEMLERLSFGPFTWRSTYVAEMRVVSATELWAEAWAPAGVHLTNRFTLSDEGGGTRITENVEIEAPRLFLRYATRTAKAAHTDQFARLKEAMEGSRSGQGAEGVLSQP